MSRSSSPASELPETTVMVVWPTIAATRVGRRVGRWCAIRAGLGGILSLGNLLALATIPITLTVFFWQLMPFVARRYRLTNRRIVVQKGLGAREGQSIGLNDFDAVEVEVLPGQDWYHAGDMVFRREGTEAFRLPGISRPEVFRQVCLETQAAVLSVRGVLRQQSLAGA